MTTLHPLLMRTSTCGQVPDYPGTLPRKAPFLPISYPNDVLGQMREDWSLHMVWTTRFLTHVMRAISGHSGYTDSTELEDFYRTNRFDIAAHYNRALDHEEPSPLQNVDQLKGAAGRRLVVLLDQHISLAAAVAVKQLDANDLIDDGDKIAPKMLLNLGLICHTKEYSSFDPVPALVANGKAIVGVIANVWARRVLNANVDVNTFDQASYDAFNRAVEQDLGATAEQVWTDHLNSTAALIAKETKVDRKGRRSGLFGWRKSTLNATDLNDTVIAAQEVQKHAFPVANIFAYSVADRRIIQTTAVGF